MKVKLTPRATKEFERAVRWWLDHPGGVPPIVGDMKRAKARLAKRPYQGLAYKTSRGRQVYRLFLKGSQHHLYYRVDDKIVWVLALWGTSRGREPRFGPP